MEKTGVNFLPRKTFLSHTEKLVCEKFGVVKGYGFLNALENIIAAPGSCGYYMKLHKTTYASIARELKSDVAFVRAIIRYMLDIGHYDLELFKKFHILTNRSLQENVILAVYGKCRVHNYGPINPNYVYGFIIAKMEKNANFAWFFEENPHLKKRQDNTRHTNINTPNKERDRNLESVSSAEKLKKFRDAFPKVPIGDTNLKIPKYVDMDLLIQKYRDSPQWLQIAKNITLKWACQKVNYDKILNDNYTNKTNFTCAPSAGDAVPKLNKGPAGPAKKEGWEREYAPEYLNNLFDSLENIDI